MTTAVISDIYEALKQSRGQYCSICFRPSTERKLVSPVFIVKLKATIKGNGIDVSNKKKIKVCYICEAMAERAVNFQHAVTVAASVEAMLEWMTDELRDAIVQHRLHPEKYQTAQATRVIKRAYELESALKATSIPQLASSHVLLVGSDSPANGTSPGTKPGTSPSTKPGTRSGGVRPCTKHNVNPVNEEPILVEDEPVARQPVLRVAVPDAAKPLHVQVCDNETGNTVLHPIVLGSDGKMYVPSLKVEVINNELLKSVSDQDLLQYTNTPPPDPLQTTHTQKNANTQTNKANTQKKTNTQKHNATKQPKSTMIGNYYDFIQQQTLDQTNYTEKETDNTESAADAILNKKARLEENHNGDADAIQDGGSTGTEVLKRVRRYGVKNSRLKQPVMQMDKVLDWEDKIPMDVISFMDATDPNPLERIMQPNQPQSPTAMGFISDVRSIDDTVNGINEINENVDNDVQLVENIECIDLC